MFFKRNKPVSEISNTIEADKQPTDQVTAPLIVHLDSSKDYPRATLFKVDGWVASHAAIESIKVGGQLMQLHDRADVLEAHPSYPFASGFSGLARENEIQSQRLLISVDIHHGALKTSVDLKQDVMLALSKQEKFTKLQAAFPNVDPVALIEESAECEVANDDLNKFSKLQAILKCSSCEAVGVEQADESWLCENGHAAEVLEHTYVYLDAEMRKTHNIKSNIEPASRAQDPLAVALIGMYKDGLILDCGAGLPFQNYNNVVNFEIEKFVNTDVVGVGEELPFADSSFDAVFSFSVLEHVKDPFRCASEIERVLKPGGIIYSSVPFLIPVHGYPHHYYNMTQQGLANLFSDNISIKQDGVPISGHPLFTLNSVANIWHNSLTQSEREAFKKLTLEEIMDEPAKLITQAYSANLAQEVQGQISCTNMILAQKRD